MKCVFVTGSPGHMCAQRSAEHAILHMHMPPASLCPSSGLQNKDCALPKQAAEPPPSPRPGLAHPARTCVAPPASCRAGGPSSRQSRGCAGGRQSAPAPPAPAGPQTPWAGSRPCSSAAGAVGAKAPLVAGGLVPPLPSTEGPGRPGWPSGRPTSGQPAGRRGRAGERAGPLCLAPARPMRSPALPAALSVGARGLAERLALAGRAVAVAKAAAAAPVAVLVAAPGGSTRRREGC